MERTRRTNGRSRIRFLSTEERTDAGSMLVIPFGGEPVPSDEVRGVQQVGEDEEGMR